MGHESSIKSRDQKSVNYRHFTETNHEIDLNNVNIFDVEKNNFKREISELLNILSFMIT